MIQNNRLFGPTASNEAFYIIKQKKGHTPFTPFDTISAHLASCIYRLMGVATPEVYIGYYQNVLSLISEVLPGYRDLEDWLEGDTPTNVINQSERLKDCIHEYKRLEAPLNIINKEALLAAAIILEDSDVVGAGFRNIGLVQNFTHYRIVKIDPDEAIFGWDPSIVKQELKNFNESLSWDQPLFSEHLSFARFTNNPASILGNLHLLEFFHDIDKDILQKAFTPFLQLTDTEIKDLVFRDEYLQVLGTKTAPPQLQQAAQTLIAKRDILRHHTKFQALDSHSPPPLATVFAEGIRFSPPIAQMKYGASKPFKVKRLPEPTIEPELIESISTPCA